MSSFRSFSAIATHFVLLSHPIKPAITDRLRVITTCPSLSPGISFFINSPFNNSFISSYPTAHLLNHAPSTPVPPAPFKSKIPHFLTEWFSMITFSRRADNGELNPLWNLILSCQGSYMCFRERMLLSTECVGLRIDNCDAGPFRSTLF